MNKQTPIERGCPSSKLLPSSRLQRISRDRHAITSGCSALVWILVATILPAQQLTGAVEKWKQFRMTVTNESWEGNPFNVRFTATFTSPGGRKLTQLGFYAGDDTWKVYFMPDETGHWHYETSSPDADLDGHTGTFSCIASDLPGQLAPAGPNNTRWKLVDGDFLMPLLWGAAAYENGRGHYRSHGADNAQVQAAIEQAEAVGATLLAEGAVVLARRDWAADMPADAMPYVEGQEGKRFNLTYWDRLNERLDAVRDRGMGTYVMIYTDDALKPDNLGLAPGSEAEHRLYRYVVARMAAYPIVLWDTGIDIREYRDQAWIDDFIDWFHAHDPWRHPVSSRHGGGSGNLVAERQTYDSVGGATIPSRADLLAHLDKPLPTAHTDHWRVFISRGDWTNRKLRTVLWRCGLSRGQAPFPDYAQGNFDRAVMEEGAAWIGHATHFFRNRLRHGFAGLEPADEKIVSGSEVIVAANPGLEIVAYDENGASMEIDLSGMDGTLKARWYNPRTGSYAGEQSVSGGRTRSFQAATTGEDWVLHIYRSN